MLHNIFEFAIVGYKDGAIFKPSKRVVKSDCVHFKLQTCLFLLGQSFFPFGVASFIAAAEAISDALFSLRRRSGFITEVLNCQKKMLSVCQKTH